MAPKRKATLRDFFEDLDDPRKPGRNFRHPLVNVLVTAVIGVACGQKTFTAIADFASMQVQWFGKILDVSEGMPSEDTYRRVFEALNPAAFERSFIAWTRGLAELQPGEVVAVDGKTLRNSGTLERRPLHLVSAWAAENGLVLGQVATEEKSNEITAIPTLINALALKGCIVTIDAMGCQKTIAHAIVDQGADYLLAVKDNQPTLHREMKEYFDAFRAGALDDQAMLFYEESDKGHGRVETRRCWTTPLVQWFECRSEWSGLASFAIVESERTLRRKTSVETRYYISSLIGDDAKKVLRASRAHWGIENRLHWCLDVTFGEDRANVSLRNLAENFSITRRLAMNTIRKMPTFNGNLSQTGRRAAFNLAIRDELAISIT
jgi:predicted transposase YbfD/YdcC